MTTLATEARGLNKLLETLFAVAADYPEHIASIEAPVQRMLDAISHTLANRSQIGTLQTVDLERYRRNLTVLKSLVARSQHAAEDKRLATWNRQQKLHATCGWQL